MMLCERLKELRAKKGITQLELADFLGVTQQAVGRWEKDITSPDYLTLKKISSYFNVSTDYLLCNDTPSYYNDPEVAYLVNELKENPSRRILFDASKDLTVDDINFVIDMVGRLKEKK